MKQIHYGTPTQSPSQPPSYSISSSSAAAVCIDTDHPQKHKTALMPHLLKQQDYFTSIDHVLDP